MTQPSTPVRSKLFARPVLGVKDVTASVEYYRSALGFGHDWSVPPDGAAVCAQVSRGGAEILLWADQSIVAPGRVYLSLFAESQLQSLCDEFVAQGGRVTSAPVSRSWGPYGFIVEDPDGNQLFFVGEAPENAA